MNLAPTDEQQMIIDTTRAFVEKELLPHEEEVERTNAVRPELGRQIRDRALQYGLYAANMPEELGGAGLDTVSLTLMERELGRTSMALQHFVSRPSNVLRACTGEQVERYLLPTIRGERHDCLAMSEPNAGSDLRGMQCRAERDGDEYVINGTKHFISHADIADYVILFAATGEVETARGPRKLITSFFVDMDTPGFAVKPGYDVVSHRGYNNCILEFDNCRVPAGNILGEPDHGFDVANQWLGSTRLQVAAFCLGRAYRAIELCQQWAATRVQFGQPIGKNQGVSFKLADMWTRLKAAEWLTLAAAWKTDQGTARDEDYAMAKLYATEMLAFVTDEAVQIFGGMGLAEENPIVRFWRDARVERIWDGTSEIQRHIISRALLRPFE
ncbi:MAG: acyl-CoA dehydrogenase family protein [Ardenticatenales bacterium]|nr:acyl-CoA dehydrogenase family protein [Ardenticatenales bacterium]